MTTDLNRKIDEAVRKIADGLVRRGMDRQAAREAAAAARSRMLAGEDEGPVRIRNRFGDSFFPVDHDNPFEQVVSEIFSRAPADVKTHVVVTPEQKQRLRRTGMY